MRPGSTTPYATLKILSFSVALVYATNALSGGATAINVQSVMKEQPPILMSIMADKQTMKEVDSELNQSMMDKIRANEMRDLGQNYSQQALQEIQNADAAEGNALADQTGQGSAEATNGQTQFQGSEGIENKRINDSGNTSGKAGKVSGNSEKNKQKAELNKQKLEQAKAKDIQECKERFPLPDKKEEQEKCIQDVMKQAEKGKVGADKLKMLADMMKALADKAKEAAEKNKKDAQKSAKEQGKNANEAGQVAQAADTGTDHGLGKGLENMIASLPEDMKLTDPLGDQKGLISDNLDGSKGASVAMGAGTDFGAGDENKTNEAGMAGFKGGAKNAVAGAPTGGAGLDGDGSGGGSGTGAAADNGNLISSGFDSGGLGGGGLGGLPGGTGDPVADAIAAISSSNFEFGTGEEGGPSEPEITLWQKAIKAYQYMDHLTLNPLPEGRGRVMALRQHYMTIADKGGADGIKIEKGSSGGETPIQQASAGEGRALASPDKANK